jgi:hypothetical protein
MNIMSRAITGATMKRSIQDTEKATTPPPASPQLS